MLQDPLDPNDVLSLPTVPLPTANSASIDEHSEAVQAWADRAMRQGVEPIADPDLVASARQGFSSLPGELRPVASRLAMLGDRFNLAFVASVDALDDATVVGSPPGAGEETLIE